MDGDCLYRPHIPQDSPVLTSASSSVWHYNMLFVWPVPNSYSLGQLECVHSFYIWVLFIVLICLITFWVGHYVNVCWWLLEFVFVLIFLITAIVTNCVNELFWNDMSITTKFLCVTETTSQCNVFQLNRPSCANTQCIHNTWEDINNVKFCENKLSSFYIEDNNTQHCVLLVRHKPL